MAGGRGGALDARARAHLVEHGAARGVELAGGERIEADLVVSAADGHATDTRMLAHVPGVAARARGRWARRVAGPSAVLVMLGVEGPLPQLAHHTLLFARDWEAGFGRMFGPLASDPADGVTDPASLYVSRTSATDPSVAPAGHEALFVLVPVPADVRLGHGGVDGAGDAAVEAIADRAIAQVAEWAGIDGLADRVVVRRTIGPADFARGRARSCAARRGTGTCATCCSPAPRPCRASACPCASSPPSSS